MPPRPSAPSNSHAPEVSRCCGRGKDRRECPTEPWPAECSSPRCADPAGHRRALPGNRPGATPSSTARATNSPYLIDPGLGPECIVALALPRSRSWYRLLGIVKAGACYLPLDPSFRRSACRNGTGWQPSLVLTSEESAEFARPCCRERNHVGPRWRHTRHQPHQLTTHSAA